MSIKMLMTMVRGREWRVSDDEELERIPEQYREIVAKALVCYHRGRCYMADG